MGKLNLYKGLSDSEESEVIEASGRLGDILASYLPDIDLNHVIIIKEGNRLSLDYEVKEDDILFLRNTPGAVSATVTTVIAIISAVIAIAGATVGIVESVKASKAQKDAQASLEEAQQEAKELAEKTTTYPFLKGASNKSALGYLIPYVIGSMYHTPYKISTGFYSLSGENGENQYWNVALVSGYNNQIVESLSIGDYSVIKGTESVTVDGEEYKYIKENTVLDFDFTSQLYDSENKAEIRNNGALTIAGLNQKVTCTSYGESLNHDWDGEAEPVIKDLEENTMAVDIGICFNGLRYYSDGWKVKKAIIKAEWSSNAYDDNPTWNEIETLTVEKNTNKTIRYEIKKTFTPAEALGKSISIRLTRVNPEEESNSNETAYLIYTNCWAYDPKTSSASGFASLPIIKNPWRDKTTRIGLKIIANDKTKDTLEKINILTIGTAPIYQEDKKSWSFDRYPTRNPASWILEILTSDAHSHSKFDRSEIALQALGAFYTYCKENEFYADGIITSDTKKSDLINKLLSENNASAYLSNSEGKFEVFIDKKESTPVALLNAQCVKDITVAKSFERKSDGQKVTFTNRDSWAVDNAYITYDGNTDSEEIYDSNSTITENALSFVTEYNHAYKIVHKALAEQKLQPREITVNVGHEGDYYPLYSLVMLQLKELKIGLSNGVIEGFISDESGLQGLQLSDQVDFSDTSKRYGIIIQANSSEGKEYLYSECTGSGISRVVNFPSPLAYTITPEKGNIYSFGYLDDNGEFTTITDLMKIYGLAPKNDGWELTLKDYNEAIYESGDIPEYHSNLTQAKKLGSEIKSPTYGDLASVAEEFSNLALAKVSKLFNTQMIQIYRESESTLSEDDLPTSDLTYNFEEKSYTWINPDSGYPKKSNGWSWEYPSGATNTVYVSYATAQSQSASASVASDDWSAPLPSGRDGASGMNSYTVTLYTRENDTPSYLPSTLTYNFNSGNLSGTKNGWSTSIPSASENSNPVWEIHALAISETETASITSEKWSSPVQISTDGITEDRVKEIVQEELSDVVETPNVYADFNHVGFAVNSERELTKAQEISTTIHVVQTNEELDFTVDEEQLSANLPSGWSYSIDYHTITFKVNKGTKLTSGAFVIPITYRSFKYNNNLGWKIDNEDYLLAYGSDEEETELGYKVYYDDDSSYDLGFTYEGVEGGVYLGKISTLSDIPTSGLTIGDYFTWTGADTTSALSQDGSFKQCAVYSYSGDGNSYSWELDEDSTHSMGALQDILSVANADLETNNSTAYEYLAHLTANSIFVDKLVANSAFISEILSNTVVADKFVSTETNAKDYAENLNYTLNKALSADSTKTVIEGGKIKTSIIDADTLLAGYVKTTTLAADYLTADEISANFLQASQIDADFIHGISGVFDSIEVTDGKITNCTIENGLKYSHSYFWVQDSRSITPEIGIGEELNEFSVDEYHTTFSCSIIFGKYNSSSNKVDIYGTFNSIYIEQGIETTFTLYGYDSNFKLITLVLKKDSTTLNIYIDGQLMDSWVMNY